MIALVTGANGFVGRAVTRAFVSSGWTVRGGIRAAASQAALVAGVEPVVLGDLTTSPDLAGATDGVNVVVHLAARAHVLNDTSAESERAYRAISEGATRAVAVAARDAGVRRVVFMSSVKVFGDHSRRPIDDATPLHPEDAYARSKARAEVALRMVLDASATEWCILRPPLVFGPGARGNFPRLVRLAGTARHVPLPLGMVRNRRSWIYVDNLASATVMAATHSAAAGETFVIADDPPHSTPALLAAIARARGFSARLIPVPPPLVRAAATLLGRRSDAGRMLDSLEVDSSRFRIVTGWESPVNFDAAIAAATSSAS